MVSDPPQKPEKSLKIIFKTKKTGHGEAHHGGAWKVAYADFVTAMMAFFLLMWLLNSTTDKQKRGIAHYFDPFGSANQSSGNRGVLGGRSTMEGESIPLMDLMPPSEKTEGVEFNIADHDRRMTAAGPDTPLGPPTDKNQGPLVSIPHAASQRAALSPELPQTPQEAQRVLQQAAEDMKRALSEDPLLKELEENVLIEQVPEGLRLQILDQGLFAMFETGRSAVVPRAQLLLNKVAQIIEKVPYPLSITGHTDARPFQVDQGYGNWELSSDRAHACRRTLIEEGIPQERIVSVIGKADTELLVPHDPLAPQNRRISLVLLYPQKK